MTDKKDLQEPTDEQAVGFQKELETRSLEAAAAAIGTLDGGANALLPRILAAFRSVTRTRHSYVEEIENSLGVWCYSDVNAMDVVASAMYYLANEDILEPGEVGVPCVGADPMLAFAYAVKFVSFNGQVEELLSSLEDDGDVGGVFDSAELNLNAEARLENIAKKSQEP